PWGGFLEGPELAGAGFVTSSPGPQQHAERTQDALEVLHERLGAGGVDDDDVVAVDRRVLGLAGPHLGEVVEGRAAPAVDVAEDGHAMDVGEVLVRAAAERDGLQQGGGTGERVD